MLQTRIALQSRWNFGVITGQTLATLHIATTTYNIIMSARYLLLLTCYLTVGRDNFSFYALLARLIPAIKTSER